MEHARSTLRASPARRRLAGIVGAIALLGPAAPSLASSIAFIRDGNVWLARPDGAGQYQVTADGSASEPYRSPTQADAGTIVAARGILLHRMRQNGEALNPPFGVFRAVGTPEAVTPLVPALSPDGATVAYSYLAQCGLALCFESNYTAADRFTSVEPNRLGEVTQLSWMGNTMTLSTQASAVYTDQPGSAGLRPALWFTDPVFETSSEYADAEATRAGDRIAVMRTGSDGRTLRLFTTSGPPPAPPTQRCSVAVPGGSDPSWAPDGSALAVSAIGGLFVLQVGDIASGACPSLPASPLIPGAGQPDWGLADVNPAPRSGGPLTGDRVAPRLLRFVPVLRGGRVTLLVTLSERAVLAGTLERARPGRARFVTVRRLAPRALGPGTARLPLGRLAGGRYRIRGALRDEAGNRTPILRTFRVPR